MKILQINAVSGIKSTGRTCLEMADYINKNTGECYIAYSEGKPYEKGYKFGTVLERKLHGFYSRCFGKQAYYSEYGTRKFLNYLDELKPDLLHLHNLHGNYINLKYLLLYLAKHDIPTVVTLHDCWFYTGKCCHYTVENCYKWQTECRDCPRIHKDNPSWFFDCTKKMFRDKKKWFGQIPRLAVVGVSDWITNEARKSFLSSAKIVTRIHNWVDMEMFYPVTTDSLKRGLGLEEKFLILGVASEWNNDKGLDIFNKIACNILEDMAIILVGGISEKLRLHENIIHIKETHSINELVAYYSMADVLINPSSEETFGKVTAEALSCGTPAIVYNSTANPELIGEKCGYVVEKNNFNSLVQKIFEVKENKKKYYSNNCVKFVGDKFNRNDRIIDYINLYLELLKK